jgi:hypothetical protein
MTQDIQHIFKTQGLSAVLDAIVEAQPLPRGRYRGVAQVTHKNRPRWTAHAVINSQTRYVGTFDTEIKAAKAHDAAAIAGANAYGHRLRPTSLNFPDDAKNKMLYVPATLPDPEKPPRRRNRAPKNTAPKTTRYTRSKVFMGVSRGSDGSWKAQFTAGAQVHHLGLFTSDIEAAKAYDAAARRMGDKCAPLNFPA